MKEYIDYILKKEKKPVEIEKIYKRIKDRKEKIDPKYTLSNEDIEEINRVLEKGIESFEYYKTPHGKYTLLSKTSFRKGNFRGNRIGGGTVICNTTYIKKDGSRMNQEEKFVIEKENCNNAVDGDIVLIDTNGNENKPSVIRIINRNIGSIVGEVTKIGHVTYVKPIDKKKQLLTIELDEEVEDGSIVSVTLTEVDEDKLKEKIKLNTNHYMGKISRVFMQEEGPHHDALLEAFKLGMPQGFSEESLKQAKLMPTSVREKEKLHRKDFTRINVFAIDGADTKDRDDAVSLEILPNGNYELKVHIADVAHYVKEGTPIDVDAFRKGTSYYYAGLVNPQLPVELSNGICSLNENVIRLTKTIIIEYDKDGNVVRRELVPSYINSRKSLTYENVNKVLQGKNVAGYMSFKENLQEMKELAYILRKKRTYAGAVIFNRPEVRFKHDEIGKPVEVNLRYEQDAEMIIEEFMLAANNNVAEILRENNIPLVYRIHDVPSRERLRDFLSLLKAVNMPFEFNEDDIIKDKEILQMLIIHINKNQLLSPMLNANLVRCMSHASYNTINIGHYGTGYEVYCHFTSPIRRLPDLANSRIIDECYFEENSYIRERNIKKWNALANDYALQGSLMEKLEEDVEKNVLYMETARYLSNYIGQEFEGTIVTLGDKGICVQLDNLLEGRVRSRYLDGDYVYNPNTFTLVSLNGKSNYYVGDRLRLKLIDASVDTKTVDFKVLEKIKENNIKDKHHSNQYVKTKSYNNRNKRPYN